jgi:hypothetical protein
LRNRPWETLALALALALAPVLAPFSPVPRQTRSKRPKGCKAWKHCMPPTSHGLTLGPHPSGGFAIGEPISNITFFSFHSDSYAMPHFFLCMST